MSAITDRFAGDDLQVEHDVQGVETTDPLIKAWFTVKTSASILDASASLQKVITTNPVQGTGAITEDGSELQGNGTASLVFQITAAETAVLGYALRYFYDIQVKTASGKIYTTAKDSLKLERGYTDATT
jgi:hypothetical protein